MKKGLIVLISIRGIFTDVVKDYCIIPLTKAMPAGVKDIQAVLVWAT